MGNRVVLANIVGAVFCFFFGWGAFGILMMPLYEQYATMEAFRTESDFFDHIWVMVLGYLVGCILVNRLMHSGVLEEGVKAGLIVGLAQCALEMVNFTLYNGGFPLLAATLLAGLLQWGLVGALMSLIRR
ncbi:MAG: hypothetical protein ISN29_06210 [Gammaproteobacteria bacterium AqS3]|nr:hypothetical protein [Gammaproteobacteria bacterium AqS3]